jgi:fucose 4-O-acetylase-like acetyltransferase
MKYTYYGIPGLTFLLALSTILLLIQASRALMYVPTLQRILMNLGSASMVIMYLHQPLQLSMRAHPVLQAEWLRLAVGVGVPYALFLVGQRRAWTRALFLGSHRDLRQLTSELKRRRRNP